jgi:hypothetical protein
VSPKFGDSEHSFILSKKLRPASIPPIISNATTLPPLSFVLGISYCGCDFKKDILHDSHLDAVLKLSHFQSVFTVSV